MHRCATASNSACIVLSLQQHCSINKEADTDVNMDLDDMDLSQKLPIKVDTIHAMFELALCHRYRPASTSTPASSGIGNGKKCSIGWISVCQGYVAQLIVHMCHCRHEGMRRYIRTNTGTNNKRIDDANVNSSTGRKAREHENNTSLFSRCLSDAIGEGFLKKGTRMRTCNTTASIGVGVLLCVMIHMNCSFVGPHFCKALHQILQKNAGINDIGNVNDNGHSLFVKALLKIGRNSNVSIL